MVGLRDGFLGVAGILGAPIVLTGYLGLTLLLALPLLGMRRISRRRTFSIFHPDRSAPLYSGAGSLRGAAIART